MPATEDLHKFGYTIGQAGAISVVIRANPRPRIAWELDGELITEDRFDRSGRIKANVIRDLVIITKYDVNTLYAYYNIQGGDQYEANLSIAAINKQDTDRSYILKASNNMGEQVYPIKISTSPEPEGMLLFSFC